MSSNNDIINNGVIDYGICCDECGYEIEDDVTGYWRDNVTGDWIDVRYCEICVWDFVKQPKRVTAEQIWRRQDEARKEREHEEEMEERIQEEARRKKNAALNKQESARLQKKEQEKEQECM